LNNYTIKSNLSVNKGYEIMILLRDEFNDSELKSWAFTYAKMLHKFRASEISIVSRGKHLLAYPIKDQTRGNLIQLKFLSFPNYTKTFADNLKKDSNILRFSIFQK